MVTGAIHDEVWTGSRSNQLAPSGWVAVFSHTDEAVAEVACPVGGHYGLPPLPDQFESWVTCNIVNKNYSVVIHEVYDAPNNRALFTRYHADTSTETTLYLYSTGEWFHLNGTCNGGQLSELGRRGGFARGSDGRIAGSAEFFQFAQQGQRETYMGIVDVEGVPCEHYRSVVNDPSGSHMVLDYYFAAPGWRVPETHAERVPVLLNLSGSYPRGPYDVHHYHHYYSFGHFRLGPTRLGERAFTVPSGLTCSGNVTRVPYAPPMPTCEQGSGSSSGSSGDGGSGSVEAGVAVALCVLSAAMSAGVVLLTCKLSGGRGRPLSHPVVSTLDTGSMSRVKHPPPTAAAVDGVDLQVG